MVITAPLFFDRLKCSPYCFPVFSDLHNTRVEISSGKKVIEMSWKNIF
jgi:hypothetical protein